MDVVLGATGFLGRNFCTYPYLRIAPMFGSKDFDLTSYWETVMRLSQYNSIENLYHFAGTVGGIHSCSSHPAKFMMDNLMMGINVISASHLLGVEKIVYVGSVCSYPENSSMVEENFWEGYPEPTNAPYGIAKKTVGELLKAYYLQHRQKSVYPVLANMYGPHDNFDPNGHVIPMLISKYHNAKEDSLPQVEVWGSGNATRDFLYVEDAVDAINILVENAEVPTPINVGTGIEHRIGAVAKLISNIVGYRGKTVFDTSKPDGQKSRRVNNKKIKQFGWNPKTSLERGLEKTYEYYLEEVA